MYIHIQALYSYRYTCNIYIYIYRNIYIYKYRNIYIYIFIYVCKMCKHYSVTAIHTRHVNTPCLWHPWHPWHLAAWSSSQPHGQSCREESAWTAAHETRPGPARGHQIFHSFLAMTNIAIEKLP